MLLEDVLSELCNGFIQNDVEIFDLAKSMRIVLLSREETDSLRNDGMMRMFKRWGVSLDLPGTTGDYAQILVKTVPMALAARLNTKESTELTRLIKLYLDVLDGTLAELTAFIEDLPERSESATGEIGWMRALRWMPKEMLELAKSKACRGGSDRRSSLTSRCNHVRRQARFRPMRTPRRPAERVQTALRLRTWTAELSAALRDAGSQHSARGEQAEYRLDEVEKTS